MVDVQIVDDFINVCYIAQTPHKLIGKKHIVFHRYSFFLFVIADDDAARSGAIAESAG